MYTEQNTNDISYTLNDGATDGARAAIADFAWRESDEAPLRLDVNDTTALRIAALEASDGPVALMFEDGLTIALVKAWRQAFIGSYMPRLVALHRVSA